MNIPFENRVDCERLSAVLLGGKQSMCHLSQVVELQRILERGDTCSAGLPRYL
jgi:hypothetical protein